ncbi:putative zinc-binding protein [Thermococcus stetteri]|uniref:putative zinc-binding protein n=1 Tax=Thermococcus stetteri TaxID=49900 RepID=UPI001AE70967|nr:putative zinc-binding protein [Thermococcus stetteri]MBP1912161.1 putative metal-binding protein [Thermococcus stetteri]
METPKVCIIVCGDSLSELVVGEALRELGNNVALCPISAVATGVEGIKENMKKARYVVVVDSCSEKCAKKLTEALGIEYDEYLNLEEELGVKAPCYKNPSVELVDDVGLAATHLIERILEVLKKL